MSITIKKIAEVSGVSRGTVDRVLNNRGGVNPETAKRVNEYATNLGYKPNSAAKALAARKKGYTIGIILCSVGNPFYDDVLSGIKKSATEYADYGIKVILKTMKGYDIEVQLKIIEELENEVSAMIITPIDDKVIRNKLNELSKKEIGIITLNTDIENCGRLSYVGPNYYEGGKIAAGILNLIKPNGANIGIIHGSSKLYGHNQRVAGFCETLSAVYNVIETKECDDDDETAYNNTINMLKSHKDIDMIYIVAAGVHGVCRGVIETSKDIAVISFDDIPTTAEMLKKGIIKATIAQQPSYQGIKSMQILFDYLVKDILPNNDMYFVENQIKIKQNYI